MRIAYLVNQYPATSHSFIRREIQALEALGTQVDRFSIRPPPAQLVTEADVLERGRTRYVLAEGALAHLAALAAAALRAPLRAVRALALALRLGLRSDRGLLRHLVYLAEAAVLVRRLREAGVVHLHAHFGTNPAAVAMLCRVLGGPPYSFTVHGPDEFDRPEFIGLAEKIRRAEFVVGVSEFGRAQLWRWADLEDWPKVHVVHCGLDGALLDAPRRPVPAAPRFTCVARLSAQKGHLVLVEAAARLAAEGRAFELLLAGDGELRGEVEARIRAHRLEERVRIGGWMSAEAVAEAIAASRALVLSSFAEGLPVVIMEAFALGRPVVATQIAGTPELVRHGESGWIVPAGSIDALVDALREALDAPVERIAEMGRVGAAAVRERHDVRREAARLAALFARSAGREALAAAGGAERPAAGPAA